MKANLLRKGTLPYNGMAQEGPVNPAIADLERSIDDGGHLPGVHTCRCEACQQPRYILPPQPSEVFHGDLKESAAWYRKVLEGLTVKGAKPLKLFVPDVLFIDSDAITIYQTNRKDNRFVKVPGNTPLKLLLSTFLRLRQNYKNHLEENYKEKMLAQVNPERIHSKLFDKFVPSHFSQGHGAPFLDANRHNFKRYVLHKNDTQKITTSNQENRLNDKETFGVIRFSDGTSQMFNQIEFEFYVISHQQKLADAIQYVQSYIKYKSQDDCIFYSEYTLGPNTLDHQIDKETELEMMILLGGVDPYDEAYKDIEVLQEVTDDLMLLDHQKYVDTMTYKMVHYLAMASRIYVSHIKIKWVLDDLGSIYLQEIIELETSEIPKRLVKYQMPVADDGTDIYDKSDKFIEIYKDMKKRKAINTLIIKKDVDSKTYDELSEFIEPEKKSQSTLTAPNTKSKEKKYAMKSFLPMVNRKRMQYIDIPEDSPVKNKVPMSPRLNPEVPLNRRYKNSSTYHEHLREHPEIVMKHRRYDSVSLQKVRPLPDKVRTVNRNIHNHFMFNMSSEDHKTFGQPASKTAKDNHSGIEGYLEREQARVSQSVLYETFCREKVNEVSNTIESQKMDRQLRKKSTMNMGF